MTLSNLRICGVLLTCSRKTSKFVFTDAQIHLLLSTPLTRSGNARELLKFVKYRVFLSSFLAASTGTFCDSCCGQGHDKRDIQHYRGKVNKFTLFIKGRDSSVGIAIRYALDCSVIESRLGRDFPHSSTPALGPSHPHTQLIPGVKRPGRGVNHPPPSSAEVKERVELYLYSLWAFKACPRVKFTFTLPLLLL
jgi:hypothetical protein